MEPRPKADDWRQVADLIAQAAGVALAAWYLWIMLPASVRVTVQVETRRLVQPIADARARRQAAAALWGDVIHLQTFGVPASWARLLGRGQG